MIAIPPPILAAARGRPEHPAIVLGPEAWTWRQLADRASRWAAALSSVRVGPGDVVRVEGAAELDWVARFFAVGLVGAVAATGAVPSARPWPCGAPAEDALPERDWPLEEPRLRLVTSGSSGLARELTLSTAQLAFSAFGSAARLGCDPADRWLLCLPLTHVGGLSVLLRGAFLQTTTVWTPRFDAAHVSELLDRGEITLASLVPAMLSRLCDARGGRPFPPRLRALLVGGDRLPDALRERAVALGARVFATWGMSETASQIATGERELRPLPFARVLADADGALIVEGPIAPNGRLSTADRGRVREDGAVEVEGRRDLVFISGGVNVDPERIELALRGHPAIADALALGLPDPVLGMRAAALLVPRPGAARLPLERLKRELDLAPAERPWRVAWVDALPLGPAGKPSRERAREMLEERHDA